MKSKLQQKNLEYKSFYLKRPGFKTIQKIKLNLESEQNRNSTQTAKEDEKVNSFYYKKFQNKKIISRDFPLKKSCRWFEGSEIKSNLRENGSYDQIRRNNDSIQNKNSITNKKKKVMSYQEFKVRFSDIEAGNTQLNRSRNKSIQNANHIANLIFSRPYLSNKVLERQNFVKQDKTYKRKKASCGSGSIADLKKSLKTYKIL